MGWLSDAFDFVTSPVQAVGSLAGDILSGRNVFDSVATAGGRVAGAGVRDLSISAVAADKLTGGGLSSGPLNQVSFGLSGTAARTGALNMRLQSGDSLSGSEGLELGLGAGKLGAAAFGGYAAASSLGGATLGGQALAGVAGARGAASLLSGDLQGALAAGANLAPGLGLPDGVKQAADFAKDVWGSLPKGGSSAPVVTTSDPVTVSSGKLAASTGGTTVLVLGAVAVGAYLLMRRKR